MRLESINFSSGLGLVFSLFRGARAARIKRKLEEKEPMERMWNSAPELEAMSSEAAARAAEASGAEAVPSCARKTGLIANAFTRPSFF